METQQLVNSIKEELKYLGYVFVVLTGILIAIYYQEPVFNTIKLALSLFIIFFIPGYFLLLAYKEKFEFVERIIAGTVLAFGVSGILSYLLSLAGVSLKYHSVINFILTVSIGLLVMWFLDRNKK